MRSVQRAVVSATVAVTILGPATVAAAAVAAPSAAAHRAATAIRTKATIPVGSLPFGVAVNPATGTVYVANTFGDGTDNEGSMSAINGQTNTVTTTARAGTAPLGSP